MAAEKQPLPQEALEFEPRLLVIDAVVQTAEIVQRHLRASGFACRVRGVATEAELRYALDEFQPHVILAGARSASGLAGAEALGIARLEAPDTAFLYWGEASEQELAKEAARLGATDFVPRHEPPRLAAAMQRALRDVAARRTRRLAEERIREAEQRLREIIDASHDWIVEIDGSERIVFSSPSVQRILGHAPRRLVGEALTRFVHPDDAKALQDSMDRLDAAARIAEGCGARFLTATGDYRRMDGSLLALVSASGAITGFRGCFVDVTERQERDERIEQLTRMLKMQSELIEVLMAGRLDAGGDKPRG